MVLNTGEYTTYKEFGLDLISWLEKNGYSDSLLHDRLPKSRTLRTPQEIELVFYGYKANHQTTQERLGRSSYDCLIRYKGEDVTFKTICKEIVQKCYHAEISEPLAKNIVYVFLKAVSERPLTTTNSIFGNYLVVGDKPLLIVDAAKKLSDSEIYNAIDQLMVAYKQIENEGRFTFQEMIDIISYIAIIEEFNYPLKEGDTRYRGRSDCFGRYVEVLFGNEDELQKLLASNSFSIGANFIPNNNIERYYFNNIEGDRLQLSKNGTYY